MMQKLYQQLIIFYYVAQYHSFTKASHYLNCSKAYVSKQINKLEREVGSPLFHRNTRNIALTYIGEILFKRASLIVSEFQSLEHTIAGLHYNVEGLLRITAPSAYADYILAPYLPNFLALYPSLSIEMKCTGQLLNLSEEKIDVAIRLTHEPLMEKVAKKIGDYKMVICAAPTYIKEIGCPKTPQELVNHSCLLYSTEKNYNQWPFNIGKEACIVPVTPKLIANNSKLLLQAAIAGNGIARLPDYVVRKALADKQLTLILESYYPIHIPVYALYNQSRIIPPKIRAFIEFMQSLYQKDSL